MRAHMVSQHSSRWEEYQKLTDAEKLVFFDRAVPFVSPLKAHFGYGDSRIYSIYAPIIEEVICQFYIEDEDREMEDRTESSRSDSMFKLLERTADDRFTFTVRNGCHFDMVVGNVAIGMSFIQVARSVHATRTFNHLSHLTGVWEGTVRMYVLSMTAIDLQRTRDLVVHKSVWAYSIAFDSATNRGDAYIDVRVRVFVGDLIKNFHLLAIPITESHTGAVIFDMVSRVLRGVLGPTWYKNLLSVAIDSAANMTGRHQGSVTRFESVCLPGFYRIWCAAHQLDLVVQNIMSTVLKLPFRDPLVSLIRYLRRQTHLRAEMGTTCPAVSTTRWHWMGRATGRILEHQENVQHYLDEKQASVTPGSTLCVLLSCVISLMDPIDACFKSIQRKDTLVVEQNVQLKCLDSTVRDFVDISTVSSVDLLLLADCGDVLAQQVHDSKTFLVRDAEVIEFIADFSKRSAHDLNELNPELRSGVLSTVAESLLATYIKLLQLQAERDSSNAPDENRLPPVFPLELKGLIPRAFYDVLELHRDRLCVTDPSRVNLLECEFKEFKRVTNSGHESPLGPGVDGQIGHELFKRAWAPFKNRFPNLMAFCGWLATTFPGTATVEADFSVLHWEVYEYRSSISKLSV